MNWADFRTRHEAVADAFEAFASQLFSRWCEHEHGDELRSIHNVGGKGGDGGVEAFAMLDNGSVIGLQAKWFRDGFDEVQAKQVSSSLASAKKRHKNLTQYIVCMPLELQGSKGRGNSGKSQLERWQELADDENVKVEFWGDRRIEDEAVRIGFQGLLAYWFSSSYLSTKDWRDRHSRTLGGYFRDRYIPDLHISGQYDAEIGNHLLTPDVLKSLASHLRAAVGLLSRTEHQMRWLPTLADWERMESEEQALLKGLPDQASKGAELVESLASAFPESWETTESCLQEAESWLGAFRPDLLKGIEILEGIKVSLGLAPSHDCKTQMDQLRGYLDTLGQTLAHCANWQRPLALIGGPGSGKTHSVVNAVSDWVGKGLPALAVPASRVDLRRGVGTWLADWIGRPQWSLDDCLSAMEASCHEVDQLPGASEGAPNRFLLVLDGLEEASRMAMWRDVLGGLCVALRAYPRILLLCTVRPGPSQYCLPDGEPSLRKAWFGDSSQVPLHEVFRAYCSHYNVEFAGQPWVQWALRSPLDIRLFATVYQGQTLTANSNLKTSTTPLLRSVINRLESELRGNPTRGWSGNDRILVAVLRGLTRRTYEGDDSILDQDSVFEVIRSAAPAAKEFSREQVNYLIDGCVTHGILAKHLIPPEDPLDTDQLAYSLAYHSLSDFLLADDAFQRLEVAEDGSTQIPSFMNQRVHALSLLLQMVNESSATYAWHDGEKRISGIEEGTLRGAQLSALAMSLMEPPKAVKTWVRGLFAESMPSNREVLACLIVPTARNTRHWCGGRFAHEVLAPMSVAERDLFWSGPDYLRNTRDAIWEGYTDHNMDDFALHDQEPFDGLPLLLAWNCSSVVEDRVRRCRSRLAYWGARNPADLCQLLTMMAETNDPQVLENLFVAAVGAATECDDMNGLKTLAETCHALVFGESTLVRCHNAILRHAARVVVERAALLTDLPAELLEDARPPYAAGQDLLPFSLPPDQGLGDLLFMDLDWYVADYATEGFFEKDKHRSSCSGWSSELDVPNGLIAHALAGDIPLEDGHARDRVEELRDRKAKAKCDHLVAIGELGGRLSSVPHPDCGDSPVPRPAEAGAVGSADAEAPTRGPERQASLDDLVRWNDAVEEAGPDADGSLISAIADSHTPGLSARIKSLEDSAAEDRGSRKKRRELIAQMLGVPSVPDHERASPAYTPEAAELLHAYAQKVGEPAIAPKQLRDGLIWSFASALGWNSQVFLGSPNGGETGEILGADLAISRQHGSASHGARSSVCRFGEKYVWSAVNEIAGYLADRLPRLSSDDYEWRFVTDYSDLGSGMPDPFQCEQDENGPHGEDVAQPFLDSFWPDYDPVGDSLLERCADWCQNAPWPQVAPFALLGKENSVLYARTTYYEPGCSACQLVAVSAFAVETSSVQFLKRDLKLGVLHPWRSGMAGLKGGLSGEKCYKPPTLACWAPWITACHDSFTHSTLAEDGSAVPLLFTALSASNYWECSGQEHEVLFPSPVIREALGVVRSNGGAAYRDYLDAGGNVVAAFRDDSFHSADNLDLLTCDRARLSVYAADSGLTLGWFVEIYREVPQQLYGDKDNRRLRRKRVHVVLDEGSGPIDAGAEDMAPESL